MATFEGRIPNAPSTNSVSGETRTAETDEAGGAPAVSGRNTVSDAPPPAPSGDPQVSEARPDIPQPLIDISTAMVKLRALMQETEQLQGVTQAEEVKQRKKEIQASIKDQIEVIRENAAALAKSKKWGLFGKIFAGIALAFTVLAAAATGGLLAPAVATLSVAMFALQESGAMDQMFDAMGASDGVRMGIMIGVSVALLVAGGASAAGGFGKAAETGAKAVQAGSKLAQVSAKVARMSISLFAKFGLNASKVAAVAQALGGVTEVAEGAATVGASVTQHQADQAQGELKRLQADELRAKKKMDDLIAALEQLMEQVESGGKAIVSSIASDADSMLRQIKAQG